MKKFSVFLTFISIGLFAQIPTLTDEIAASLSEKPLHCINQEYPNKTAHVINNEIDVKLTPKELHPSFMAVSIGIRRCTDIGCLLNYSKTNLF